jgi:hypothetical protein
MASQPNYVWTNNWGWQPVGAIMSTGRLTYFIDNRTDYHLCYSFGNPCMVLAPGVCVGGGQAGTC